jgi:succinate dehydrogenase / fumarate reductase, cytochrome b subunit
MTPAGRFFESSEPVDRLATGLAISLLESIGELMSVSSALAAPRSSIATKYVVAITGLALTGFVLVHMLGNLLIYLGQEHLNNYAQTLKSNPGLLWTARLGLLAMFVLHVVLALQLKLKSRAARPTPYVFAHTEEASFASRTMVWTGLAILFFLLYHLAHFTLGLTDSANFNLEDANRHHDVYSMVVRGFQNPLVSGLYILAMIFLGLHMSHGVQSTFQTLGITRRRWDSLIYRCGMGLTLLVVVGNISMPLAILCGLIKLPS